MNNICSMQFYFRPKPSIIYKITPQTQSVKNSSDQTTRDPTQVFPIKR